MRVVGTSFAGAWRTLVCSDPVAMHRQPSVAEFPKWRGPRLGIDLGGTAIKVVVTGDDASILAETECATGDHANIAPVLARVGDLALRALRQAGVSVGELRGAGIGLPGEVDVDAGLLRSSAILPSWRAVPVARLLGERLSVALASENDANATLLAEHSFGAARGACSALLLTIGTGIGGAVMVDGKLIRGHRGCAGEVGHVSVDPRGPQCWCGQRGCLGMMASAGALVACYRENAAERCPDSVNGLFVAQRYEQEDPAAKLAVARVAYYLAQGISAAACVLAPERVILFGGVVSGLAGPLLSAVRQQLAARAYPAAVASLGLVAARLGPHAGAIGATLLSGVHSAGPMR